MWINVSWMVKKNDNTNIYVVCEFTFTEFTSKLWADVTGMFEIHWYDSKGGNDPPELSRPLGFRFTILLNAQLSFFPKEQFWFMYVSFI